MIGIQNIYIASIITVAWWTMYEFDVVILADETGGYVAFVPALPGCHTQGETLEELMENVKEAIELYLETLTDEEREEALRQRKIERLPIPEEEIDTINLARSSSEFVKEIIQKLDGYIN